MHIILIGLGLAGLGCAQNQTLGPRVTLVATSTPGVKYVVVRPSVSRATGVVEARDRDGTAVDPNSEYLLYCDGRKPEGMVCHVVTEAGENRRSIGPQATRAAAVVNFPVGTLDTTIEITHVERHASPDQRPPAAPATATTTATPPPPPPTTPPPPPADPVPPTKEKKK